jgi:hypothetical protein
MLSIYAQSKTQYQVTLYCMYVGVCWYMLSHVYVFVYMERGEYIFMIIYAYIPLNRQTAQIGRWIAS